MIRSFQGEGESHKWKKHFPVIQALQIFIWRLNLDHSIHLWKDLSLSLIVKRFQKLLCSVSLRSTLTWCVDILFEKSTPETGEWIWKTSFALCLWGWGFHAKPVFFFNIFTGDPHYALIEELYYICLIIGQTLGMLEKVQFKRYSLVYRWAPGIEFVLRASKWTSSKRKLSMLPCHSL